MILTEAVVVVTGGASGIGAAMAAAFAAEGARAVVIADVADGTAVAAGIGTQASFRSCDVTMASDVVRLVERVSTDVGPIDLFCANAGVATGRGVEAPDDVWSTAWSVNVMGIVHSTQAYLPKVAARGRGHLLVTASAAGLLTNLGDAPYTATKHAAVGLAEWLAITHADDGLTVQCLCPQGVRTPMVTGGLDAGQLAAEVVAAQGLIEPEACAAAVVAGLATDDFLILPHPEVRDFMRRKVDDPSRWLRGMRTLRSRLSGDR
jgi:NAD(P)-dependent dehydrogenase (short-subunit alcohol dehydrogenase family)